MNEVLGSKFGIIVGLGCATATTIVAVKLLSLRGKKSPPNDRDGPISIPYIQVPLVLLYALLFQEILPFDIPQAMLRRSLSAVPRLFVLLGVRNIFFAACIYGSFYYLFDAPGAPLFNRKFNPRPTDPTLVKKEVLRWARSLTIGTAMEIIMLIASARGYAPSLYPTTPIDFTSPSQVAATLATFLALSIWADLHFYIQHRAMHTRWCYRTIHCVHHESRNPNVWSGLSFHPFEATSYYTALCGVWLCPHPTTLQFAALRSILDISPIFGHVAADGAGQYMHYLHHVLTDVNFGGTSTFDKLFGTYCMSEVTRSPKLLPNSALADGIAIRR